MSVKVEVEEGFIPFNFANSNACPRNEQIAPSVKLSIILDLENESGGTQDEVESVIEENFADLLLSLLSKHIIEINVNGKIISIDSGTSPDMFIGAIQRLPLSLLKKVNDSYENYKRMEAEIITVKHSKDGETTEILLDITTGLFTGI